MNNSGFKDPIEVKGQSRSMKSPFDFTCPEYDQRSSVFVNAGSHYGVGHKQPVGHEGNPKQKAPTLPQGRVNTLKTDRVPKRNLPLEMEL